MTKLSRQTKIMLGSILFVALLMAVPYFVGKYLADEHRLIERFERAVNTGDADKLYQLLAPANENLQFKEKAAEEMVAYLQSNEGFLDAVIEQLEHQADLLRKGEHEQLAAAESDAFVYLHNKNWKRWIFFEDYELKVNQYMIPVQTNVQGALITVNGEEVARSEGEESVVLVGPLMPGEYSIEAVHEGEYTTLRQVEKLALYPLEGYSGKVELVLEGEYVTVHSNNPQAKIKINGEDIGLQVGAGQRIGPITLDGSDVMSLEAEYPWGTIMSDELKIDSRELEFVMEGLDEELTEAVIGATELFANTWMKALQAMDPNTLLHANPDRISDLRNQIDILKVNGQKYIGNLQSIKVDRDSISLVSLSEGGYSVLLQAQLDFSEVTYRPFENIEPVLVQVTMTNTYELMYEDGQWVVTSWYESA